MHTDLLQLVDIFQQAFFFDCANDTFLPIKVLITIECGGVIAPAGT